MSEIPLYDTLQPVRQSADGTIFVDVTGRYIANVTKQGDALNLYLTEMGQTRSNFRQSCLDLNDPLRLVFDYTRGLALAAAVVAPPAAVAVLGVGGGTLPNVLYHAFLGARIYAVDQSRAILNIARRYFGLPDDERLVAVPADGRTWLAQQDEAAIDVLLVDVFLDNGHIPYSFATREFFSLCRRRLRPGGLMAMNIPPAAPFFAETARTIIASFASVHSLAFPPDNVLIYAADQPLSAQAVVRAAQKQDSAASFRFPLAPLAALVQDTAALNATYPQIAAARVLTDAAKPAGYGP